ncbi:MAG: type IV pilin protein [Myxococcota bacterium]
MARKLARPHVLGLRLLVLRRDAGFTLIELMIVVAVIGILASLAIPAFQRMQLRTRRSEAWVNMKGIATAQIAYEQEHDAFVDCSVSPTTALDKKAYPFDVTQTGWSELDWKPEGKVYCHYAANVFKNSNGQWVRISGLCDLDDDNKTATWYLDVDPFATSTSSAHMVLRASTTTLEQNLY